MAQPPRFKAFTREDYAGAPDWFTAFLLPLNEVTGGLVSAISRRLTRRENLLAAEKVGLEFTTRPAVAETFPIRLKNALPSKPVHLWATRLEVVSGTAITTPWSLTWRMATTGEVEVSLQGLDAQTTYRLSLAYE